eukprot:4303794-Prymnesium_polylepis.1
MARLGMCVEWGVAGLGLGVERRPPGWGAAGAPDARRDRRPPHTRVPRPAWTLDSGTCVVVVVACEH